MKKKLLSILFLLLSGMLFAGRISVTDPGDGNDIKPNIQTAIDAAAISGDTLNVPEGSFIFLGTITTTKKVSLMGAGKALTIISRSEASTDANLNSWVWMIKWNIDSDAPSYILVSGITFKSKLPSMDGGLGVRATGAITFTANPSSGHTITMNGVAFTYTSSAVGSTQIAIGGSLATTLTSTATVLNASASGSVNVATYSASSTVLSISYDAVGLTGNSYTLAASNATRSGATLSGGKASSPAPDGKSLAEDVCLSFYNTIDFIVRDCNFYYFGHSGITVVHKDEKPRGLIYHCRFIHCAKGYDGRGLGYAVAVFGNDYRWIPDPGFGSINFIFIEDCYFDNNRHDIASAGCGKYVARYDSCVNTGTQVSIDWVDASMDTHYGREVAKGSLNHHSTRAVEAYHNVIIHTKNWSGTPFATGLNTDSIINYGMYIRGGACLYHHNTISGVRFGYGMFIDGTAYGTTYPIPYAPGYMSGAYYGSSHTGTDKLKGVDDAYIYSNTFTLYIGLGGSTASSQEFINLQPAYFTSGRDYHYSTDATAKPPKYREAAYPHYLRTKGY